MGHAEWDKMNGVDAYDINLYKGSGPCRVAKAYKGTTINFYPYMTSAGTYTFKVRSAPSGDSQKDYADSSDWTESDELYTARRSVSNGRQAKIDYNNTNSAANNSTSQVGWIQDGSRWWLHYATELPEDSGCWSETISGICLTKTSNYDGMAGEKRKLVLSGTTTGAMRKGWVQAANGWYYLESGT